jgi:hypothetical protein
MRASIASRHAPQSVPAPQQAPTASTLRAPALTAASISRSVTARQMQRTMGGYLILRLILNIIVPAPAARSKRLSAAPRPPRDEPMTMEAHILR